MSRILITGANPYNDNKGVAALCYSLVYVLDDILSSLGKQCTIAVYNHEYARLDDEIKFVDKTIRIRNVHPSPWRGVWSLKEILGSRWKLFNLKEFLKSDLVLSINAGDSFADIYGDEIFGNINASNLMALFWGKPLALMPQTYGPFNEDGHSIDAAKKVLKRACYVSSRDTKSTRFVENLLPVLAVDELIDLAFFLPYKSIPFTPEYVHVGLNVSALLWNGGFTQNNQFGLNESYEQVVREVIEFFLNQDSTIVHLVPHVVGDTFYLENDYSLAYELWKEYGNERVILSPFFISPIEAKNYISGLDMFVGSRMHACIAAISSGVPVVPMAYSRKFSGLFRESLGYRYGIDLKVDDSAKRINELEGVFGSLALIRTEIGRICETVIDNRKQLLYDGLKGLLEKYI